MMQIKGYFFIKGKIVYPLQLMTHILISPNCHLTFYRLSYNISQSNIIMPNPSVT